MNKQINLLERELGIQSDNYCFEEKNGEIIEIEIFDNEYSDLIVDGDKLIDVLSNFACLKNIEITLRECVINDISKLENLKALECFQLECSSNICDLSVFENLKSIKSLFIPDAKITDLNSLKNLIQLESLILPSNKISNIDCLDNLKKLRVLNLAYNQISDIQVLSNFLSLESLMLDDNNIVGFSSIQFLKELNSLSIKNNKISDISFLKNSNGLKYLYFDCNQVVNCDAISSHKELVHLSFRNNQVCDISCLQGLTKIIHLDISDNPIKFFLPVFELKEVAYLNASNVVIDKFVGFENLTSLRYLFLNRCLIEDLSFLKKNTKINTLSMSDNNIKDVSVLFDLKDIKVLILENNKLSNIFPLHLFYDLHELDLRGNLFGDALYVKYLGYKGVSRNCEAAFTFDKLSTLIGDAFLINAEYNEALAFCYFERPVRNQLIIYTKKFVETVSSDIYYLKYYFSKCTQVINSVYNNNEEKIEDLIEDIKQKVVSLAIAEKNDFLYCLENSSIYFVAIFEDFFEYYNENHCLVKNSEVIYLLGKNHAKRETLLQSFSIYKELKSQKDPLGFRLYKFLRRYLDYNFAYTDNEKNEYNKYRVLLDDIDRAEIPYFDYMDFIAKNYKRSKYFRPIIKKESYLEVDYVSGKMSFSDRFEILAILCLVFGGFLGLLYVLYLLLVFSSKS